MEDTPQSIKSALQAALLASQRSRLRRERSQSSSRSLVSLADEPSKKIMSSSRASSIVSRLPENVSPEADEPQTLEDKAVSLLDSSSAPLRKAVGLSLGHLLSGEDLNGMSTESKMITHDEMEALTKLARSKNVLIRNAACDWILTWTDILPRGKLAIKTVLQRTTSILVIGKSTKDPKATTFALTVGRAIAQEGDTWAKRMISDSGWNAHLVDILLNESDIDVLILAMEVCALLAKVSLTDEFLAGCVRCIRHFPKQHAIISGACTVLGCNQTPIEDEAILHLFLETAADAANAGDFKLVCDALKVVRAKSHQQARKMTLLVEEADIMGTLNALYRSQTFGSKLECALFMEALVLHLHSDFDSMVRLCEVGIVVRLIRLASPSAGTNDDGHELAYMPAINALSELSAVDRIGARIVLAGGLGPLFSHANSTRPTRPMAKKALQSLGVTNLGAVVDAWIKASKASRAENGEEPLEKIVLTNGKKLLWAAPPPGFFSDIVNDPKAVLGRGAFSVVYKATLNNGDVVAVKRLTKAAAADPGFAEEIRVLARVPSHPNIIGLLGVYLNDSECLIISEFGGPTLASVLAREKNMDWKERINICIGIADGIRHLHGLDPSILHLDIKASNVLLVTEDRIPKLCDFGLAVEWKQGFEFLLPSAHGTIQYMAPECMRENEVELSKGFDAGADVYSFAMLMWEVAHPGKIPWQNEDLAVNDNVDITMAIRQAVLNGRRPKLIGVETWPKGYDHLMKLCWDPESEARPKFIANFFEDESSSSRGSRSAKQTIGSTLRKMLWELRATHV